MYPWIFIFVNKTTFFAKEASPKKHGRANPVILSSDAHMSKQRIDFHNTQMIEIRSGEITQKLSEQKYFAQK